MRVTTLRVVRSDLRDEKTLQREGAQKQKAGTQNVNKTSVQQGHMPWNQMHAIYYQFTSWLAD